MPCHERAQSNSQPMSISTQPDPVTHETIRQQKQAKEKKKTYSKPQPAQRPRPSPPYAPHTALPSQRATQIDAAMA
ncbi:hypothetical protein HYALB_00012585 [Hymenoscyphus albidus]|uniref:Uncharacterized protein n=1 Tax=Hymenoscyphus albidus TaxID=595503 RepID=A0A9N9LKZ0_9HELO|nr:hypothetical protein HYALB_00012585 [Hymenoscyphus albidus]